MTIDCKHEAKLAQLEARDASIQEALLRQEKHLENQDLKLDMILTQVTKVAVLETNHAHHSSGLERAFAEIGRVDHRFSDDLKKVSADLATLSTQANHFIHNLEGKTTMLKWVLLVMGSGLGLTAMKVLFGGHA